MTIRVMSDRPKISVITPTFNGIVTLRETIESVLAQDFDNWEHIVIDGGSTDGTVDLLRSYRHLKWVSEKDKGHYHAMNKGIERASGEIIGILNADDCYRTGALAKVADAFAKNPQWDAVFTDVAYIDGEGREIFRREEAKYDYDVLRFGSVCYVVHPTLFVKKAIYEKLGNYRYDQFLNCCDVDFILRLGENRCHVGHIPQVLVNYRMHEHGQSADRRVAENTQREYLAIRKEHGVPGGIIGKFLEVFARTKRQLQKLIYRGKLDLTSGKRFLKKHMREKTSFSSNIGVDKL
jgi:glycosyltransferase involved in cell wall biosynthesis